MTSTIDGRSDARLERGRRTRRVVSRWAAAAAIPIGLIATAAPGRASGPIYDSRFCPSNSAVVVNHTNGSFLTFSGSTAVQQAVAHANGQPTQPSGSGDTVSA